MRIRNLIGGILYLKNEQMKSDQELMGQANAEEGKYQQVVDQVAEQEDGSETEQIYQIFDEAADE